MVCREPLPTEIVVLDETPQLFVTYGIDGRPYPRAQFWEDDGHEGCTPTHIHADGTVYPIEEWLVRGGDGTMQVTGPGHLTDPDKSKCGFGAPTTLGPPNVLATRDSAIKFCEGSELSWIETRTEFEELNLERLVDLCNTLRQ
ncbi:MAG: hypothetical protein O2921_09720 [Chloroflexi bacterium]|nr:hypothetical protein [Chloroflexota bacterium]MDA1282878.1 hypothetical protein [Chloroflexota bacterium]